MDNISNDRRIAKNTLLLYFRMALIMMVTLYTSRIVLNKLGVEDYGIYNVVGGVVAMFGFFNSAMSSATQRFLSFELGKGNFVEVNKIFNAAQSIHLGIALVIFILAETVGLWFLNNHLVIPLSRLDAAHWVFHFSVFSFMVTIIQVPYNAVIIAHERMQIFAYLSVLEVLLKLLSVFMLTWISFEKLKLYGLLLFAVSFIMAVIYRIYTRIHFDEIRFFIVKDKMLYKILLSYSGWNLFGNISVITKNQGISIVLNMFFGPIVNAAQAIATQVQAAVLSFVGNFQMAVNPQIIKSYAAGNKDYMFSLILQSVKFSFYLLFLITLPIIIESKQILKLWLYSVPDHANTFTILTLIVILIDCLSGPVMTAITATGKIKTYHIVIGTLVIMILPISYFFLELGYPPEIVLYVNILISIIAFCIRLYVMWELLNFPIVKFLKEGVLRNILIVFISTSLPLIIKNIMDENFIRLIVITIISLIWNIIVIYTIGLNKSDKEIVKKAIKNIKKVITN